MIAEKRTEAPPNLPRRLTGKGARFGVNSLTPLEIKMLFHVAHGEDYSKIATVTGRSAGSIKNYMIKIRDKLGAYTNAHAVYIFMRDFEIG